MASGSGLSQEIEQKRKTALLKLKRKHENDETLVNHHSPKKRAPQTSSHGHLTVNVSLVSPRQFAVQSPYDNQLLQMCKKISSREYNSSTREWTFAISDYAQFIAKIKTRGNVTLKEPPKSIVNVFQSAQPSCPSDVQSRISSDLYSALMQFQKEGVEYSIARRGRVLLGDDMGLGKTIQSIAIACYYRDEWPLLVVCPSSVKMYWAESFNQWVPDLSKGDVNVTSSLLEKSLINIISFDALKSQVLTDCNFSVVICDESHFLKNYKTMRAKALVPILKQAKRAILLSGTPALSRPIELYTQITAIDLSFKMRMIDFGIRYCNGVKRRFGWDFSGASNLQELQLYLERKLMIRRLKRDVLDQLPPKRRRIVVLDPSLMKQNSKEKEFVKGIQSLDKSKEADKNKDNVIPLFSKTAEIKLPAICQYILDMLEGSRKLVVFSHHRIVMDGICELLDNKNYQYIRIDGSTPPQTRSSNCDTFQHDPHCLVAVLSLTAAGTGITLTASSTVIFTELFWNPGMLVQAEDRVYRIGQRDSVNIDYLVAKGTVDDYLWPLINKKLNVLCQAGLSSFATMATDTEVTKDESHDVESCDTEDIDWFSTLNEKELEFLDDI